MDNCSFLCVSASVHVDITVWIGYVQHDEYRGCRIIKVTQYGVWVLVLSMSDYQSYSVWSVGSGAHL